MGDGSSVLHTLHHCDTLFRSLASTGVCVSNLVLQVHLPCSFRAGSLI